MFGEPRLEPDWVNDAEWEENMYLECEAEVDSHPEGVECNKDCAPEDGNHVCGFSGEISVSCVGQRTYSAYYSCPQCGDDGYKEMESGSDW